VKDSHSESKSQRLTSVHVKHPQSTHNEKPAIAIRNGFNSPAEGIDDADKSPRRKGNSCNDESQGNRPVVPAMPIVTAFPQRSLASERQKPPICTPSQNLLTRW